MGRHYEMPVVEMASASHTLVIGSNAPAPDTGVNPLWMRWNNYGIGLLDAQQYSAAVDAFGEVARLRPDYADAHTNIGLALSQWEKFEQARPEFERALALSPGNARALYYLALVERNEGNLDAAIADFEQVTRQFPEGRDAHRELGFTYYQQRKYELARAEYEKTQAIDPDDLAAHYKLASIYRRLGMPEQAEREAAYYADQRDDPMANTAALEFFGKHPEISNESVPWHAHALDEEGVKGGILPAVAAKGTGSR